MLSVDSVKLFSQPAFRGYENDYCGAASLDDYPFDAADFEKQCQDEKSAIEEKMEKLNEIVNNQNVAKPLRTGAKIISVILGAALGAVGLKYGTVGMIKLGKDSFKTAQKVFEKPLVKNVTNHIKDFSHKGKEIAVSLYQKSKNSECMQKITDKLNKFGEKYANSKAGQKLSAAEQYVSEFAGKFEKSKTGRYVSKMSDSAKEYFKNITPDKVEKGVVNLFTVSGAVTGGLNALDMAAKEQ